MGFTNRLFKIESSELGKVLDFTLLGAILQAGISIGMSAADSLFLSKLGPDKLPLIYLFTPLIFLVYIPIYSYLTSRIGVNRVFQITISILAGGGVAIYLLLNGFDGRFAETALYLAKLYSILWYIALYTLYWNFVDGFFDILDAKRVFSALSAGSALGAALGGGLVTVLSNICSADEFFLVWSMLAVCAFPSLRRCLKKWRPLENEAVNTEKSHSIVAETKSLLHTFRTSAFAVVLGSLLFLTMVVTLICEYQYSNILSQGKSEAELTRLFGTLFFAVNGINLFINLFVFNRLVLHFGVRNVALIQPLVYLSAFTFFIFEQSFMAGVFAFFAFHGMLTSIDFNNTNLLINALPKENKRQLRTFIEGICEPMANAVAGLFLIFLVAKISPTQISTIGLICSFACLALALILRGAYLKSMISNLRKSWLDFNETPRRVVKELENEDYLVLERSIIAGQAEISRLALTVLVYAQPKRALPHFLKYLSEASKEEQEQSAALFNSLLYKLENKPLIELAQWVESNISRTDSSIQEVFIEHNLVTELQACFLLGEKHNQTTASAAIALKGITSLEQLINAFTLIKDCLSSDENGKCSSLRAISYGGSEQYSSFIVPFLKDPLLSVRIEALKALEKIVTKDSKDILPKLMQILENGSAKEKLLCLECFAKIADHTKLEDLLRLADRFSPAARRRLEEIIVDNGLTGVPVSVRVLKDKSYTYRSRSIAARCLSRLSATQLEALSQKLILEETSRAAFYSKRKVILANAGRTSLGQEVLAKHCADQETIIIDFVLELLALNGRVANFELLLANLRSTNKKERADAIETIQQACDSKTNNQILPLLYIKSKNSDQPESGNIKFNEPVTIDNNELFECLKVSFESSHELEAAAAAEALSSFGYELGKKEETEVILRDKLASLSKAPIAPSLLVETIVAALTSASQHMVSFTTIRRIALLQQSDFLSGFSSEDLRTIAEQSSIISFKQGQTFTQSAENLYLIIKGSLISSDKKVIPSYTLLGERTLFNSAYEDRDFAAEDDCILLQITRESIQACMLNDATLSIYVLQRKAKYSSDSANAFRDAQAFAENKNIGNEEALPV